MFYTFPSSAELQNAVDLGYTALPKPNALITTCSQIPKRDNATELLFSFMYMNNKF